MYITYEYIVYYIEIYTYTRLVNIVNKMLQIIIYIYTILFRLSMILGAINKR